MAILFGLALLFLFFFLVFLELLLFGSEVDPDDNGMIRTPLGRERYRQRKLKQREKK